jgi:hypothetical protein
MTTETDQDEDRQQMKAWHASLMMICHDRVWYVIAVGGSVAEGMLCVCVCTAEASAECVAGTAAVGTSRGAPQAVAVCG